MSGTALGDRWRASRPPVAGLHLDNAACSRQSFAVLDAAAQHARHEAEVGGYVAAEAAKPVLDARRSAVAALAGMLDAEVVFTTGSLDVLNLLLGSWPPSGRTLAWPAEYGPNLAVGLSADPPDLVHLTAVSSHRGVVQPLAEIASLCPELQLPLVVDAAQALGQVDCAVGADATYASSREWIAGPRGVGAR